MLRNILIHESFCERPMKMQQMVILVNDEFSLDVPEARILASQNDWTFPQVGIRTLQ